MRISVAALVAVIALAAAGCTSGPAGRPSASGPSATPAASTPGAAPAYNFVTPSDRFGVRACFLFESLDFSATPDSTLDRQVRHVDAVARRSSTASLRSASANLTTVQLARRLDLLPDALVAFDDNCVSLNHQPPLARVAPSG